MGYVSLLLGPNHIRRATEAIMATITKPVIANPEIEFDADSLRIDHSNGDVVTTWDDQTANGNDATQTTTTSKPTYLENGWSTGIPAVEFLDTAPSNVEEMVFDDTPWTATNLTLFIVAHVIDITEGAGLIGTSSGGTPPREVGVGIKSDGSVHFGFGDEGGGTNKFSNIQSAAGLVEAGDKIVLSARHTSGSAGVDPEGMLLRLNGVEIAANSSYFLHFINGSPTGTLGRTQKTGDGGPIVGLNRRIAWVSGYSTAASNEDMAQMECYLGRLYGVSVATCPPPDTVRATVILDTTVTTELELTQTVATVLQLEGTITEDVVI